MPVSENELIENNKRYLERIDLYRKHGYDVNLERSFVIEKALPVSGNILEVGTGKGYFSLALDGKKHDVSGATISEAKTVFEQYGLHVELYCGDHQDVLVAQRK